MKNKIYFIVLIIGVFCVLSSSHIHAGTVFGLPDVVKPTRIAADNQRLFVVDGTSILIYSLKDFTLIKKFAREGEGPGELKSFIYNLEIHQDYILVYSEGRLSWFSLDGTFIKQKTGTSAGVSYKVAGDSFVGLNMLREKEGIYFGISLFDSNLKKIKEFYRYRHPFFGRGRNSKINAAGVRVSSYRIHDNKIFIDKADGSIWVYDCQGRELNRIYPALKKTRITSRHKKQFLEFWRTGLKQEYEVFQRRLEFPDYFPLIRDFLVNDGKLYVLTYQEKEGNSEILILAAEGKLLKRSWIPMQKVNPLLPQLFSLYTIKSNKLYILQDNEDTETWEIQVINL